MKTSALHPATPSALVTGLFRNRDLLWELVKRDFIGRYKGSIMGMVWSLFNPLLMLAIYATVFSVAFQARWGTGEESKVAFALVLFSGMIIHSFFAECINRAPSLIISHPNYVKKVVFPLDLLPCMALCSALLHFFVSFSVLLMFCLVAGVPVYSGAMLVPLILLPLALLTLGASWILASLGVYLRDLSQVIAMVSTIALFMAPVFYPIENLPEAFRSYMYWNPITLPIIQLRDAMLWNKPVQWSSWLVSLSIGTTICFAGYWWFQKSRRGFADVI